MDVIISGAHNQTFTKAAASSKLMAEQQTSHTTVRFTSLVCWQQKHVESAVPTLQRQKSHPVLMNSVPRRSSKGYKTLARRKRLHEKVAHSYHRVSLLPSPRSLQFFHSFSASHSHIKMQILKLETHREKHIFLPRLLLNKACSHIAASDCHAKPEKKTLSQPPVFCFLASALSFPTIWGRLSSKVINNWVSDHFGDIAFCCSRWHFSFSTDQI